MIDIDGNEDANEGEIDLSGDIMTRLKQDKNLQKKFNEALAKNGLPMYNFDEESDHVL